MSYLQPLIGALRCKIRTEYKTKNKMENKVESKMKNRIESRTQYRAQHDTRKPLFEQKSQGRAKTCRMLDLETQVQRMDFLLPQIEQRRNREN